MLTLTAPSEGEHLGWVVGWDGKSERPQCGCHRSAELGLGVWNASAAGRWNRLRTALRREYPHLVYFRAVEVQDRGAIHLHVIVWTARPLDLRMVQSLAVAAGFGCVLDFAPARPGDTRQAHYVSKYVTKSCDLREATPWETVDRGTGELTAVPEATYRTWSSSADWGMKMRELEAAIRLAAARRAAERREPIACPAGGSTESRPSGPEPPGLFSVP